MLEITPAHAGQKSAVSERFELAMKWQRNGTAPKSETLSGASTGERLVSAPKMAEMVAPLTGGVAQ